MKTAKFFLITLTLLSFIAKAQTRQPQHSTHSAGPARVHHKSDSLVRGVSFNAFRQSVTLFVDSTKILIARKSWRLWKKEEWRQLERFFTTDSLNGGWPPNYGAATLKVVTMEPQMLIDRFGGYYTADSVFHDKGTFVCREGVPFAKRALPASTLKSPYREYKIIKAIPDVKKGVIIPWFNEPGLGIQYNLPCTVDSLVKGGYIVMVNSKPPKWVSSSTK